ncbi:RNA polymerase sigma factor [Cupriavidus necator]|uniref:RNA polymerase sigma factor n=1 Tax=Cupriavidus necator TaxID=106590 RepID=UPI0039C10564
MISDVDDAVQEALLVLSRQIASVRVLAALSGWLFRVVQRECRRLDRKALRCDPFDEENWRTGCRPTAQMPCAWNSLPAEYRQIIFLRDFEELAISEIAERLGITRAATKSRLHRARLLAREHLLG